MCACVLVSEVGDGHESRAPPVLMAPGPGPGVIPWAFPVGKGQPLVFYYTPAEFIHHITEPNSDAVKVPKDPPAHSRERLRCVLCGVIKTDRRRINIHRMAGCPKASPPFSPMLPYISFAVGESHKEKRILAGIQAGEDVSTLLGFRQQCPSVVDQPIFCPKREAGSLEEADEHISKRNQPIALQAISPPKSEATLRVAGEFRPCSPLLDSMPRKWPGSKPGREATLSSSNRPGGGGGGARVWGAQNEQENVNVRKETVLDFYVHEIRSGAEATLILAAGTGNGDVQNMGFGSVLVFDNEVREGGSRDSKLVGRERGYGPVSDLQGKEGVQLLSKITFNSDSEHSSATLTFCGNLGGVESPYELIVLGGTGHFRGARGYALVQNCPPRPPHFIFHWSVHLTF